METPVRELLCIIKLKITRIQILKQFRNNQKINTTTKKVDAIRLV